MACKISITHTAESVIILSLGFILIWDIGIYPAWFDHIVAQSIWPEVNQVFDGRPHPLQGIARWQWQDMYQHNAGLSPIYGFFISSGLKFGGLSLLSVRLPQTLLTIVVCCFAYTLLRNRAGQPLSIITAVLLGTSPWFLLMMRSGGIIGFSMLLAMFSVSLISLIYPRNWHQSIPDFKPSPAIAFIAGFSVSLLPYGHSSVRLIALLLMICVPASFRIIGRRAAITFMLGSMPLLLLQLSNPSQAAQVYFLARGEGLFHVAAEQGNIEQAIGFFIEKLSNNFWILFKILFGLNDNNNWLNNNIADSYWRSDVIIYPKFLMPFFLIGLLYSLKSVIQNNNKNHLLLLLALFLTTIPSLMSGLGTPNQARLFLSIIPIYLTISMAACMTHQAVSHRSPLISNFLLATLVSGTAIYQTANFFSFEKGVSDEKSTYQHITSAYFNARRKCPESTIILHEFPEFSKYSYVTIRWRGGNELQDDLNKHSAWLLDYNNFNAIKTSIHQTENIVFISQKASADLAQQLLGNAMPSITSESDTEIQIQSKGCRP